MLVLPELASLSNELPLTPVSSSWSVAGATRCGTVSILTSCSTNRTPDACQPTQVVDACRSILEPGRSPLTSSLRRLRRKHDTLSPYIDSGAFGALCSWLCAAGAHRGHTCFAWLR